MFVCLFVEYRALCLLPVTHDQGVPRAFIPDAQTLLVWLSEVKQTHYYGMEPSSVSGSPGSLGTARKRGEAGMGNAGGSKDNIVANASRWAPPGRELGDRGEATGERPRQPRARWREGKMVAEARDEGVRKQTVKGKSQDHSPWRWGPGDQEGLGVCHSLPHSPE